MRLNLLYQFNEKYAPYAGVSIFSVLQNNKAFEEIHVYILGEELSEESMDRLRKMVSDFGRELSFIETEELILKMKALDMPAYRGSYAANMRLFPDEVFDESVDKFLYLDADTIVDGSLIDLLQTDMHGKTLGMILDSLGGSHKGQIGLSETDEYFNSGVILFDMSGWRKHKYSEKIEKHVAEQRNNYPAPDQDLLNVVCKNDIFRLDVTYNFQPIHSAFTGTQYFRVMRPKVYYSRKRLEEAVEKVVIYHCFRYIGEFPWHSDTLHPFTALFDKYLAESPWKDYKKEAIPLGFPIKVEKILYKVLPRSLFLPIFKMAHALFVYQSNRDTLKNKTNKLM
ncbi:MAG: glycosyltransferase family 8 protein [Lachnospiraceae bacterium]|nr:glycosyltransferase family 8 protein [Lachnospiraceae bacterium]